MEWRSRIVADASVLVGKPVIKGTRISVEGQGIGTGASAGPSLTVTIGRWRPLSRHARTGLESSPSWNGTACAFARFHPPRKESDTTAFTPRESIPSVMNPLPLTASPAETCRLEPPGCEKPPRRVRSSSRASAGWPQFRDRRGRGPPHPLHGDPQEGLAHRARPPGSRERRPGARSRSRR